MRRSTNSECLSQAAPAAVVEVHTDPAAGGFGCSEQERPSQCARVLPVRCLEPQARNTFRSFDKDYKLALKRQTSELRRKDEISQ